MRKIAKNAGKRREIARIAAINLKASNGFKPLKIALKPA
jgi:hypothetical protein